MKAHMSPRLKEILMDEVAGERLRVALVNAARSSVNKGGGEDSTIIEFGGQKFTVSLVPARAK